MTRAEVLIWSQMLLCVIGRLLIPLYVCVHAWRAGGFDRVMRSRRLTRERLTQCQGSGGWAIPRELWWNNNRRFPLSSVLDHKVSILNHCLFDDKYLYFCHGQQYQAW